MIKNKVVYKPMKIVNKKVKQNDLINQKYFSNFCFIKSLLYKFFALQKQLSNIETSLHIYVLYTIL
jgi:hypothetical protein